MISPERRREIIDALRRGTVPHAGLDLFAVQLERFTGALDDELALVSRGGSVFKAVRGEYGSGKTFFARYLEERAKSQGFAASEVQVSESETPLHRLETVYRRLIEQLATPECPRGAFQTVIDTWLYTLVQDLDSSGSGAISEEQMLLLTKELLEKRLTEVSRSTPVFAAALRGYVEARHKGDAALAQGLLAWLGGQPNVGAAIKRTVGIKGDVDHFAALGFLQGLLLVLRDANYKGLVLVLDEVETLQRVRGDVREKALNALRQWIDDIDAGRFPGLYLLITGTPQFFEGTQGVKRLPPLAQRLHVEFDADSRFDNPKAVQLRLRPFRQESLQAVGCKVRDLYAAGSEAGERIRALADDRYVAILAQSVTGSLGGKVGIAPRIFLKKLVGEVLDRIEQYPEFNPREHYKLTLQAVELNRDEQAALTGQTEACDAESTLPLQSVDDIELPLEKMR